MGRLGWWGALVWAALGAAPAVAAPSELALLVLAPPGLEPLGRDVEAELLRLLAERSDVHVEPTERSVDAARHEILTRCELDIACFAARLAGAGQTTPILLVSIAALGPSPSLGVRRVEPGRGETGSASGELADPSQLASTLERLVGGLIPLAPAPNLIVQSDPPGARFSAGALACETPCRLSALPGRYEGSLERDGSRPWRGPVEVVADRPTIVTVRLDDEASIWTSPWLWVVTAAAVVGAGVGVALAVSSGGGPAEVCLGSREQCGL